MTENIKEEDQQQKANEEETNSLNPLKDEEYVKKINENSHLQKESIIIDSNLVSNKDINCSLSNEWNTSQFPNFLVDLTSQNKPNFPIDKYLSNQSEDNIFYQHPNLINEEENDTFILNSFRELEVDLMNKWFENYEYFDYYLSLYHQELFLNEERKLESIDKFKEKIKINLEKELKSLSNNQTFKFNLILLKFSLKELSSITLDNIDELSTNISNFENYSKFLDDHFEVSFLLTKEINDLIKKLDKLLDNLLESNIENKENILGKLLIYEYNIVFGLKSLFGILNLIKKINLIESKGMLSKNIIDLLMDKIKAPNLSNLLNEKIEKIEVNSEIKSYIKLGSEEFNFNKCNFIFINKDIAYMLNEKNTLYKIYKTVDVKNKYNIVEINNNIITSNDISLISLEKEYLFGFDSNEFGKSEKVIQLLKTEHQSSVSKNKIEMDETAKKILTNKSNEIINDIYLNLFNFEPIEKEQFLNCYIPNIENDTSLISIAQNNSSLFILHPIYKKKSDKNNKSNPDKIKNYFFSENYIFVIDEFELYLHHPSIKEDSENILNINYKNSYILKTSLDILNAFEEEEKKEIKTKYNIDEILTNIKNKNKFFISNKFFCFTNTCQKFFDLKKNKICIFDKELNENDLIKDISEVNKENSIIVNYENSIFYLSLIKTTLNNVQEIQETEYKVNNRFNKRNIFLKKRDKICQIQNIINRIFSKSKAFDSEQKEDIFKEIFQTFEVEENLPKDSNNINEENDLKENICNYILSNLFIITQELNDLDEINCNINKLKANDNSEMFSIIKYLKRPFIINIDFPTIKSIEDLIEFNLEISKSADEANLNIFCLLFILDNHLSYLNSLKINSKFLLGNLKNIEALINLLSKIYGKNKEFKNICSSLIIKILTITEDYPVEKINSLFKEILYPIDFIENQENLYLYLQLFRFANYSKMNMKLIFSNEISYKFIFELIDSLLTNEKSINISSISEFFNEFILFYNNIISFSLSQINGIKFSKFINNILSICLKNLSEEKITSPKILQPLLYNFSVQCLNNYKLLPKDFYLQNWSYIYDILYQLQNIRNTHFSKIKTDSDLFNKKDFILDTFNFSSDFQNNKPKEYFFGKLNLDQEKENKDENEIKEIDTKDKAIYISLLLITKAQSQNTKNTGTNAIMEIMNVNNCNEVIYSVENILSSNKVEIVNKKIEGIDISKNSIKIKLYPQSQNYLIKMRISNYQFYNEKLDILINPFTELMNKILNKFSFYYTNEENEIFNLFHTRLFSRGFANNSLLTKKETKDEEQVLIYLKENNNKEFLEFLEPKVDRNSINDDFLNKSTKNEDEKTITKYNNENCATYLENEYIIKCINIFKEKQNIFIRGEIPDKIVNISFLIILKHENLLSDFIKHSEKLVKNDSFSPDDVYYLTFNKCNDLRKTYKEIKDEIIKNEKENQLDEIFNEIFNRLYFLFNLNSEKVVKKGKETNNTNMLINMYVREHVNNISQIIKNDKFNLSNILNAYRLLQSQAKFREISLIILNNIIKKFEDKQCVENIIENYYKSYCFQNINDIKFPNIYESLNSVSENLVLGITNNFNFVINSILDKLINIKKDNKNNFSYFDLIIYLNFLLWQIKRRNYPTTQKIFEFFNKNDNPLIEEAKKYLFSFNKKDKKNSIITYLKDCRIMDEFSTSKILSDIFIYYYQESIIIEINKKDEMKGNLALNLMRGNSVLLQDTYDDLIRQILLIFNKQFQKLLASFNENEKIEHEQPNYINQKYDYNLKLTNLLNEFTKLALTNLEIIFSEHELWKQLYKLLPHSNYQNTCLIFNLLKKFTAFSFDFFNEIFEDEFKEYSNEKYYDFLFNIMKGNKYKSLLCDYLNYIYININKDPNFLKYIENKIRNENQIFLLEIFGYKLQYLTHLCNVRVNTNLNLDNRHLTYKPNEKEITHLIKNGYYFDNFKENSINNIINEKKKKEEEEILRDIGEEDDEDYFDSDDENTSLVDAEGRSSDDSNSSREEDAAQEDHFEERNLDELLQKKEITRDIKILSKKIYGKTPNFFNANENEIIIEENYLDIKNPLFNLNESLIECIINYLEKKIITENKFSPKLLIEYISIIKCLIANSKNKKVKDFVTKNITVLKKIVNILINPRESFNLYSSEIFLLKNKIELALGGLLKLLPNLGQESKLLIKDSEEDDELSTNKNEKILKKIYSTYINHNSDIITLYLDPTKKLVIPILNKCDLSELDFMTNESYNLRKIEVEILNKKVYKSLLDKYTVNGRIKEGTKYPDVNDKMIIITEDLLKEIGISDLDYFESPKNIRKVRENRSQTLADENEDSLNQQEEEIKEKDADKKDSDKSESGTDFSLNEEDEEEKSNKEEKNKVENEEPKEEKEENKKEEQKEETKKEEKEKKNENVKEKNKDKAENYYTKKEPEIFKSEKWNEFYDILDFKYQLGNCIFLVDNNLFYRFPKRFICYGLECSDFNTNELDEEKLESKIVELTKSISYTIPDYVISSILNDKNNNDNMMIESESEDENFEENEGKEEENKIEENNIENNLKKEKADDKNENADTLFNMNNNLYEEICNKFAIKVSEKNEKIIDRNLELPLCFADLYNVSIKLFDFATRFKSFNKKDSNGLLNSEEYKVIKYFGVYLLKYYITLLLIKEEEFEFLDINDFKFMFYITLYYNNYFGLSEEHALIKNILTKYLDNMLKNDKNKNKISIDEFISQLFNNNIEIFNLELFLENISKFNEMIQEEFLSFIIEYLINNFVEDENKKDKNTTDEKIEYTIINDLFNKLRKYYNGNNLEKCIILYRIVQDSIKLITEKINPTQRKNLLMNLFKEQKIIKFLLGVAENSKRKMQRTDFSIYTIEFLLNVLNIFLDKNITLNKTEIASIENIQDLINLCNDYEIINEKLNSKYIINKLIVEDEEWCKLITMKKYLPNIKIPKILEQSSYGIHFIEDKSECYTLKINNKEKENKQDSKCITSFIDIVKNDTKETKNKEGEKEKKKQKKNNKDKDKDKNHLILINEERKYDTNGNELIIMHEPQNKIKSIAIGDMKRIEDELKNQVNEFKNIFNFNEKTLLMIDTNNKFYSAGEWFGSNDDSEDFEIQSRPELDKLNSEDKFVYIGQDVILSKTSLYFFKDNLPRNLPSAETLFDGKVLKFPLPELKNGEVFIKAMYESSCILLTNKKKLYGFICRYGNYHMISSSELQDGNAITQIKTPENLEIFDFDINDYNLIYIGYDTKKRQNLVYGNLNLDRMHFFTKNAERNLSKDLFMKEISFLSDKNITNIYLTDDKFVALSKPEGKVYCLDEDQYGIRSLRYFLNLNIRVKDVIQRGYCFFFVIDEKTVIEKEEEINENNNKDNKDNKENNSENPEDNYVYFYRYPKNIDIGKKIFYSGNVDICKLVGEKDSVDRAKLKKPRMINIDEDFIKQNYLKKKTDLTLKIKDILYNGNKFFLNFDYYQSFINPKKILEESNYVLKNEKLKFNVILKSEKDKIYFIDMISKYDKTDKYDEYEQFLFQIESNEISSLSEKEKEKYNKFIEDNMKEEKCNFIYIFDLDENDLNLDQIDERKLMYIQIIKEQIFEFIDYLPQIKKIVFDLPKKLNLQEEDETYLSDNLLKVKELYKNRLTIENNLNFKKIYTEKIDDDLLEMKMEISNEKIQQFFPEQHKAIKEKVINLLSSINVNYLLEYQKIYPIYIKEMQEIKNKIDKNKKEGNKSKEEQPELKEKTFMEYMKEKYQFYDRYIKFSEQPQIIETVGNIVSEISKSAENLLNHSAILYNTSLTKILFNNINFLSEKSRIKNFSSNLLVLKNSKIMKEVRIDRMINLKKSNMNLIDKDLEWSLIAQLYKSPLGKEKGSSFFKAKAKNLFQVILLGEGASDAGGPGREIFSSSIEQLTSANLDLFIPSPNNKSQTGLDRDKYIFNPLGAKNEKYLEMYKFIGKLFGYIISSETFASINLSSIVYKQILGMQLEPSDIELIDVQSYKSIIKVLSSNNIEQKQALFGVINFTCQLPGGETIELKEKGSEIYVDENNYEEFLELYLKAMTNQGYLQAKAVQEGLFEVIPEYMLKFLTPSDLEKKICGEEEFDLELLKNMTKYEDCSPSDLTIKYFWQFLEELSLEDKFNYIKFVWGRSRLPKDAKGFGNNKHKITLTHVNFEGGQAYLPISHTCFFELELPKYDNYALLKNKMLYAIRNSLIISDGQLTFDIEI